MSESDSLQIVISRLVPAYNPRQIYLYGSRVWGDPSEWSDLDILVVVEESVLDMDDRMRIGLSALSGSGLDVDILVLTSAEVQARRTYPSTLTYRILHEGKKLYEAA
ncbi:MAG TPA: nucleotidyltransferase domain-containing protein [Spirochaetota bacterium]|nr:nucleotidyltransferase domain-containing protein [Spirochaetota bacterium]